MSYTRPTYSELNARITADLANVPAPLAVPLAAMWARACNSQHGYLDWIADQCSPLTCELERLYDWALLYAVDRLLPVAASGYVMSTGSVGAIMLGDALLRAANGLDYQVMAAVTLSPVATAVQVRCTSTGAATNMDGGQSLSIVSPIVGVDTVSIVGVAGITGGADAEDVDAWRLRVVESWQATTLYGGRSGKPRDYRSWAQAAHPSISGALVQQHALGYGTVVVRPICNALANRLPTQPILDAVAVIYADIAPATADWRLVAPLVLSVSVAIDLGVGADTSANRTAITDALTALINTKLFDREVLQLTEIDAAILSITSDFVRTLPAANVTAGPGEIFVLAPIAYS